MNSSLLSPSLLHGTAVVVFGSAIALVAIHSTLLAWAGPRTTLPQSARVRVPLIAAILLGAWLAWAIVVAQERALAGPSSAPPSPLAALPTLLAILGAIGLGSAFLASRSLRTLNAAMPPWWLIAVQVYRAAGVMFIWPFIHVLPAGFALPAGIGDAITGLAAPFVALAVARRRPGAHRLAVAWNWFGIADLIIAPTAAVLSGAHVTALYPVGLIPIFLGPPLGILTHIYSLRNLAANHPQLERTTSA
jgi:hypothetical protein